MSAEEDAKYVCSLDEKTLKKAKDELNENPQDRLAAVQALREWIQAQPHIRWPALDTMTMLVFLRGAKFSQLRAREMLEGNLQMRKEAAHWFCNVDTMDEKLHKVVDTGFIAMLPGRDKEGRSVVLQRIGLVDPYYKKGYDKNDTMRIGMLMGMLAQREEMTQVNGMIFMMDFTGITAKHMSNMMANTDMKKWHTKWQKNSPGRFKKFIMYNAGSFVETMMAFFRPFMAKKYQERSIVCDTAESLYEHIPKEMLPVEYLPDDYKGPNAGPVQDLVVSYKNLLNDPELHKELLWRTGPEFSLDESKRPTKEEVPNQLFRKLNVD